MKKKKVYSTKDLFAIMKKTNESMKKLDFATKLNGLLLDVYPELGSGKKINFTDESNEFFENTIKPHESFLEYFEEHEKNVAELKKAILYISSTYVKSIEEK